MRFQRQQFWVRWLVLSCLSWGWTFSHLQAAEAPTYSKDVAPILNQHCANCHRPGAIGPFSLLSFEDAAPRADFLVEVTANRQMPPWKAEPAAHKFVGERRLSEAELATLAAWAKAGAPRGNVADLPPAPTFNDGWQLGTPDLILKMPKPTRIPADGADIYQCFAIPIPISSDQTVAAIEFHPGNRKVVHHAIFYLDSLGQARAKDRDGNGFRSFGGPGIVPTGGLGGWAPGYEARRFPEGTGRFLGKGSDLVLQLHYHPSGKEELDQSELGLYFTKQPAEKIITGIIAMNHRLNIPAGEAKHKVTAITPPTPVDVEVIAATPHMHLVGRQIKMTAKLPDGKRITLVNVPDWDFNWQGGYLLEQPLALPKGTVFELEAVYDNSEGNPVNPNHPPRGVHWGEQTTDEMCLGVISVTTNRREDLTALAKMPHGQLAAGLGGGLPYDLLPKNKLQAVLDKLKGLDRD